MVVRDWTLVNDSEKQRREDGPSRKEIYLSRNTSSSQANCYVCFPFLPLLQPSRKFLWSALFNEKVLKYSFTLSRSVGCLNSFPSSQLSFTLEKEFYPIFLHNYWQGAEARIAKSGWKIAKMDGSR